MTVTPEQRSFGAARRRYARWGPALLAASVLASSSLTTLLILVLAPALGAGARGAPAGAGQAALAGAPAAATVQPGHYAPGPTAGPGPGAAPRGASGAERADGPRYEGRDEGGRTERRRARERASRGAGQERRWRRDGGDGRPRSRWDRPWSGRPDYGHRWQTRPYAWRPSTRPSYAWRSQTWRSHAWRPYAWRPYAWRGGSPWYRWSPSYARPRDRWPTYRYDPGWTGPYPPFARERRGSPGPRYPLRRWWPDREPDRRWQRAVSGGRRAQVNEGPSDAAHLPSASGRAAAGDPASEAPVLEGRTSEGLSHSALYLPLPAREEWVEERGRREEPAFRSLATRALQAGPAPAMMRRAGGPP
jgi:hypothetical protein